jgi:hypothetical protein
VLQEDKDDVGGTIIRREPDAAFKHPQAHWPGVVIEVAYSQKERDIPHLADDYILETNGSIRAVVGLNIDYKTKKGTVSMWRPKYTENEQGEIELAAAEIFKDQVHLQIGSYTM